MNQPTSQSDLQTWIDWLLNLHAKEVDLGLVRVSEVAGRMQISRPAPFVITVAGTNGKGSSVAMLSRILVAQGYRVGSYTSPHILRFNERIQIDHQMVCDREIVEAFAEIESVRAETKLTYFEFSTLAALAVFKKHKVDVAVLEVGLGGRLDAVNLVDADAALITPIDVDHVDWLGDDREKIALEKAGVMRAGRPAVCSDPQPPQSLVTFAKQQTVPLSCLGRDFTFSVSEKNWSFSMGSCVLNTSWPLPALKGRFQVQNAAGVLALLCQLYSKLPVSSEAVIKGLRETVHPGRLQTVKVGHQNWLIDVAHNPQSAEVLAGYLTGQSDTPRFTAVFSVLQDKESLPMVKRLAPWIDRWLVADLGVPRATGLQGLKQLLNQAGVAKEQIDEFSSIGDAVSAAQKHNQSILVWGSFFTVSQAFEALQQNGKHFV